MMFYFLFLFLPLSLCYDPTSLSTCLTSPCPIGCSNCTSSSCSSCLQGYNYSSSSQTCTVFVCSIAQCSRCDQEGHCLKCINQYAVYDKNVMKCVQKCFINNCRKCKNDSQKCQECENGYAIYSWNNQCIKTTISNCKVVHDWKNNEFQCSICTEGFRPTVDRTQCIIDECEGIKDCQNCGNSSICDNCRPGYSFNNGTCSANICSIQNCLYCSSSGICLCCASGYSLSSQQCVPAVCSHANCQLCKPGSMFCDSCASGFVYEVLTNKCVNISTINPLPLNCESMRKVGSLFVCLKCLQGYIYKDSNRVFCIRNCSTGCSACASSAVCTSCSPGYNLSGGVCSPFPCSVSNCSLCDLLGACIKCTDQYYLYNSTSKVCESRCNLSNCLRCKIGSSYCEQCIQGYALDTWSKTCILSPITNCLYLHDWRQHQFQCSKCISSYRPTHDRLNCIPQTCYFIDDCEFCQNSTICERCRLGYSPSNNKCIFNPCSVPNCLYCDISGTCIKTMSSHTIEEGVLVAKRCNLSHCSSCIENSHFCSSCEQGCNYNIWNNQCIVSFALDQSSQSSSSNLKYLWFLMIIPAALLISFIVYRCIRKEPSDDVVHQKPKENKQPNVSTQDLKKQVIEE